tara:strand:- start:206 stop:397 length:192 start_codon:yes stop_codon:yes gene_type:complete
MAYYNSNSAEYLERKVQEKKAKQKLHLLEFKNELEGWIELIAIVLVAFTGISLLKSIVKHLVK